MITLTWNDSLRQFIEMYSLEPDQYACLVHVHYRGRIPETVGDWWYIYQSIVFAVEHGTTQNS